MLSAQTWDPRERPLKPVPRPAPRKGSLGPEGLGELHPVRPSTSRAQGAARAAPATLQGQGSLRPPGTGEGRNGPPQGEPAHGACSHGGRPEGTGRASQGPHRGLRAGQPQTADGPGRICKGTEPSSLRAAPQGSGAETSVLTDGERGGWERAWMGVRKRTGIPGPQHTLEKLRRALTADTLHPAARRQPLAPQPWCGRPGLAAPSPGAATRNSAQGTAPSARTVL